jgi:hypothetical protein
VNHGVGTSEDPMTRIRIGNVQRGDVSLASRSVRKHIPIGWE